MGDSEDEFSSNRNRNRFDNENELIIRENDDKIKYRQDQMDYKKKVYGAPNYHNYRNNSPLRNYRYDSRRPVNNSHFRNFSQNKFNNRKPKEVDPNKLMSFKEFVSMQVDDITPSDAIKKYENYKCDFSSRQVYRIFDLCKKYECFLISYHPYYYTLEHIRRIRNCKSRLIGYIKMKESGLLDCITLDDPAEKICKFLYLVGQMLERDRVHDINDKIEEINKMECNNTENVDEELIGSLKRKYNEDNINESESLDACENIPVELSNVNLSITKRYMFQNYHNLEGFKRIAMESSSFNTGSNTFYLTFCHDVDSKNILSCIKDIPLKNTIPTSSILNLSPIVRSYKNHWNSYACIIEQINISIKLIESLDEHMHVYDGALPKLPDYDLKINLSKSPDSSDKSDSEIYSDEETDSTYTLPSENTLVTDAKIQIDDENIQQDIPSLLNILDSLILYLRIVHSYDFYSSTYYSNEHDMPNRCHIFNVRKNIQSDKKPDITIDSLIQKSNHFIESLRFPTMDKMSEILGDKIKTVQKETNDFLQQKVKEVRPGICTCEICEKKFQAVEYVHKHINNKHQSHLRNIEYDVMFYNYYLYDQMSKSSINPSLFNISIKENTNEERQDFTFQNRRKMFRYNDLDAPEIKTLDF